MILTDSCVFIDYFKNDPATSERMAELGVENIVLNSVILMELLVGARNRVELNALKKRLNHYRIVEVNQPILDQAVQLLEGYSLSHGLKIPDAIIAATATFNNISLLTYNTKDFRFIPGIKLLV